MGHCALLESQLWKIFAIMVKVFVSRRKVAPDVQDYSTSLRGGFIREFQIDSNE